MRKNHSLFQARWLEDERFKHWIRKKMTLLQYVIIALKMSVLPLWKRSLTSHMKGKKHVERSASDQCIKDATNNCFPFNHIKN